MYYLQEVYMDSKAKRYLIGGVILLSIGITMLMTRAMSKPVAYGDIVLAIVFFALSLRKD